MKIPEFGFESDDAERRGIELHFLFEIRVRRVIGRQDRQRAISDSFQQRIDIRLRSQRRIHFVIRIEVLNRFVGQRDVMRTNFAADFDSARARLANQAHASGRADVLAMNVMIAKFREQNVAHHDRFLARRRPAGQTKQRAPVAFVHHAVADQIVILAMIEHRQPNHARVLHRAPHQLVVLNATTVIRDCDHARLRERADRRQFFAREIF